MRKTLPVALLATLALTLVSAGIDAHRIAPIASATSQSDTAAIMTSAPAAATSSQAAQTPNVSATALSARSANYSIDVRLDAQSRTLIGREVLTWRNTSRVAAPELRFHLYYNAWRNTQSSWLRERSMAERSPASASPRADEWGWIDVRAVRLLGGRGPLPLDLTGRQRFIAPDDGNADDRTVMAVALPLAVEPGETINIEIEWTSKVPRTFARTGAIGNFFFIAQWFPKIGVLEDSGWNCHQFHSSTEFFADYGVYDVRMTVPTGWIVGATGVERERRENMDGTSTHHYYQEDVHDFAWTTSPDYVERKERFEHSTLPAVDMRLLLQPEHLGQAARHFAATRAVLRYYGEWFGAYPYGHITVVDPAWQSDADGMEYPTLFTAGTQWLAPEGVNTPETVTVHEAGHQFFYGIVGNNEFEHALMDEGLNLFSEARVVGQAFEPSFLARRYFGGFVPWVFGDVQLTRAVNGNRLSQYRAMAKSDTQSTPAYLFWPPARSGITYAKTALWLHTLERYLGWPMVQRIMSTYFNRWKFRHAKPQDFFAIVNEVSGQDLTWFFDEVYRGSNVFDYGVERLSSRPADDIGFFDRDGKLELTPRTNARGLYRTTVVVRRYGEAVFPVEVAVTFENGETVREWWNGRDRWKAYTYNLPTRATSVQVDPGRVLLLDVNYTNNSKTLNPKTDQATTKWMLKWMTWVQDLMLTYAFFI